MVAKAEKTGTIEKNETPREDPGVTGDLLKNCGVLDLSRITENSILVIRGQYHSSENIDAIMKILKPHLHEKTLIWLAQEGEALEVISEDEMNRLGWYRKKA